MDPELSRSWNFLNKLIREFLLSIFRSEALFGHPVLCVLTKMLLQVLTKFPSEIVSIEYNRIISFFILRLSLI